ncbi:MAG: hypothetical protein PHQ65_14515 [Bacteroidales bacterium]|nr:hypothetical protein [Bacteroidales bacterium]MDD3666475.1 hypothetical protein [Bacteroidales bacterium]
MKTLKFALLVLSVLFFFHSAVAGQTNPDTTAMRTSTFHISFVTPVGTNGMESWNTVNKISLNLFGGYSGGVDGAEFSGFGSIIRGDVQGFQGSGFANVVMGRTEGAQFAGFANVNKSFVKGAQFAGFANVVSDSVVAFQGAGFSNVANGSLTGVQVAGFANVANGRAEGVQIAGFANVAKGDLEGAQIAGFINVARDVQGLQLGVINVSKSVKSGAAIGFLSIVKDGYRAFEVSSNESFYGMVSFKTGIRQFYNILSVGASVRNDKVNWGWGYGFGTLITVSEKSDLALEAMSFHVNEDEWFTDRLNLLNRLQATFSWRVGNHLNLFGGPSFNVMVSKATDKTGKALTPAIVPWTVYDRVHRDTRVQMYPGFSVGVRL